eukprot:UN33057
MGSDPNTISPRLNQIEQRHQQHLRSQPKNGRSKWSANTDQVLRMCWDNGLMLDNSNHELIMDLCPDITKQQFKTWVGHKKQRTKGQPLPTNRAFSANGVLETSYNNLMLQNAENHQKLADMLKMSKHQVSGWYQKRRTRGAPPTMLNNTTPYTNTTPNMKTSNVATS